VTTRFQRRDGDPDSSTRTVFMADIPIQRKEGHTFWPWLIAILVLIAIVWFLFARRTGGNGAGTAAGTPPAATAPAPAGGSRPTTP
jgi:hypothetical protein